MRTYLLVLEGLGRVAEEREAGQITKPRLLVRIYPENLLLSAAESAARLAKWFVVAVTFELPIADGLLLPAVLMR